VFRLTQENRHLAEALDAVIRQQKIAIAAIYDDGYAEGRLAERLHPARGYPGERHLHAVPSIRSTGTLGQKVRDLGTVERGKLHKRLQRAGPAAGLVRLQARYGHAGPCRHLGQAPLTGHPGRPQAPAHVTVKLCRRLEVPAQSPSAATLPRPFPLSP
jgi:hypothetical protein